MVMRYKIRKVFFSHEGNKYCLSCFNMILFCQLFYQHVSSKAASHNDDIFGKTFHFGHFKASKFTIEVQHSLISLTNLAECTMGA